MLASHWFNLKLKPSLSLRIIGLDKIVCLDLGIVLFKINVSDKNSIFLEQENFPKYVFSANIFKGHIILYLSIKIVIEILAFK